MGVRHTCVHQQEQTQVACPCDHSACDLDCDPVRFTKRVYRDSFVPGRGVLVWRAPEVKQIDHHGRCHPHCLCGTDMDCLRAADVDITGEQDRGVAAGE